jgi:hypothetical protein
MEPFGGVLLRVNSGIGEGEQIVADLAISFA